MVDLIKTLAENAAKIQFNDLPPDVVEFSKLCILDSIGVLVAGFDSLGCRTAVELAKEWGGKPESTILRYGVKAPCPAAAFANSIFARALDFDSAARPGLHLNASTIPTAFAVGEMLGSSGKEVITSIAVGEDLALRINRTTNYGITYGGFDPTGICGVFATATVAGKLLESNEEEMHNALGIAFNRAAGSFQNNVDGCLAIRYVQGFTASSGIISAILAKKGVTGPVNVLEGVYGYYNLFSRGKYDRSAVLEKLGKEFLAPRYTIFKRWPSCGATLSPIDGALELKEEYKISAEDVNEVVVIVGPYAYNLAGQPFKDAADPKVKSQFNVQYGVANVLVRGRPKLEHYTEKYIFDAKIQNFLPKVKVVEDKSIDTEFKAEVHVKLKSGKIYRKLCGPPKGHPENPITREDVIVKFHGCVGFSSKPLFDTTIKDILEKVLNLEKVDNIKEIISLLYE
ncbi:MAG: MmgE/PrpD family protein [Candidatus Bathyarchaeia archaeon]